MVDIATQIEPRQAIGQILVERGLITVAQLEHALELQQKSGERIGEILVREGLIDRMAIASALAIQWNSRPRDRDLPPQRQPQLRPASIPTSGADSARVESLLSRIEELEAAVRTLNAALARRDDELGVLTEIITGDQTDDDSPVEPAPTEPPAAFEVVAPPAPPPSAPLQLVPKPQVAPPPDSIRLGYLEVVSDAKGEVALPPAPPRLGELLVGKGLLSNEQLSTALAESRQTGERLGRVLLRNGWIFESELARTLSEQWNMPYIALAHVGVDAGVARLLPVEIGLAFAALPVRQTRNGDVHVAFADPSDEGSLEIVRQYIGTFVPGVAELTDIETTWRKIAGALPSF